MRFLNYKDYLNYDFTISPIFHIISVIFLSLGVRTLWSHIFLDYDPDAYISLLTFSYSSIAIYLASRTLNHFINSPTQYVYAAALLINMVCFGLILSFIVFARLSYHRPDLLIIFCVSCLVLMVTSWIHETRRSFVFYTIPVGRALKFKNHKKIRVIGKVNNSVSAPKYKILGKVDGIVVDFKYTIPDKWQRFLAAACVGGVKIYGRDELIERLEGYVPFENIAQIATEWRAGFEIYSSLKRLGDVILVIITLPIIIPIVAIVMLLIRIDSPGPALFMQERVGYKGRIFTIYKLRTMIFSEKSKKIINTQPMDKRITRIGSFLRKTRIDELPQVINVLIGDMSWIGPRPETVELTQEYMQTIPLYQYRNCVRPGISGWAAVNQGYVIGSDETAQKLNYDLYYIKNFSFELDIIILFKTIYVLISGHGAR